ncbi:MAG TPA: chemotaxis protein CheW, partial [bacterium]|nr:chemotaxis protein CheW [bacterium]
LQLVVFRLGREQFAAPITRVREILRPVRVSRMPRTAPFLRGLFNLRGQVLPLLDTKARLGMQASPGSGAAPAQPEGPARDNKARVMVLEAQGENVGLMVDEVLEVLRCDEADLQAPRTVLDSSAGRFLAAVLDLNGRLVLVLDLDRLVEGAAEAA